MSRKPPPPVVQDSEFRWNDGDFNLHSLGVEAPEREVFEMLADMGGSPKR